MNVIYLHTRGPLGTHPRSDTLWGLIVAALARLHGRGRIDEIVHAAEQGRPLFRISSAFPFLTEHGARKLLVPRPLIAHKHDEGPVAPGASGIATMTKRKRFKKQEFLPLPVFEQWLNGEADERDWFDSDQWLSLQNPVYSTTMVHTSIDRHTMSTRAEAGKGQLFSTESLHVLGGGPNTSHTSAGLYILCEGDVDLVMSALRLLSHTGMGADASVGNGRFDAELQHTELELRYPGEPTHFVTLSLYAPAEKELLAYKANPDSCWYDIERRQGRLGPGHSTTQWLKQAVIMFKEGSVFPWLGISSYGRVDVVARSAAHAVRHSGLAFALPAIFRS